MRRSKTLLTRLLCHVGELPPWFLRLVALISLIDAWQIVGHRSLNLFGAIEVRWVASVLRSKVWRAVVCVHTMTPALCIEEVLCVHIQVVASCHCQCLLVLLHRAHVHIRLGRNASSLNALIWKRVVELIVAVRHHIGSLSTHEDWRLVPIDESINRLIGFRRKVVVEYASPREIEVRIGRSWLPQNICLRASSPFLSYCDLVFRCVLESLHVVALIPDLVIHSQYDT